MSRRRVVVTGMGVVSALGLTPDAVFDSIIAGTVAGRDVERWHDEGLRVTRAAIVDKSVLEASEGISAAGPMPLPWGSVMGLHAARAALRDAGLPEILGDTPLVASCTIGAPGAAEPADKNWLSMDPTTPSALTRYAQGALVAYVAHAVGASGPVQCVMSTCAGGNYAIGNALDLIESGRTAVVLAGGLEETSTMVFTSFHQLRAIADKCTPFDVDRQGLLFGEGAAFLVLEDEEHAKARGGRIHAYVLGIGYANDAHHLVQPDRDGAGAARAVRQALVEAEIAASAVDYLNAHGTGTEANDAAELAAYRSAFADAATKLTLSSTKGATGHLMGAASALEAIITTVALQRGVLPQTVGLKTPIADAGVDLIRGGSRQKAAHIAVSTGFGFGGNDAALVLSRAGRDRADVALRPVYVADVTALHGASLVTIDIEGLLGKKGLRHVDRAALLWAAMLQRDFPDWPAAAGLDVDQVGAVFGAAYPAYEQVVGIMRDYQKGGAKNVNPMRVPYATANCAVSWWLIRRGITGFSSAVGSGECAGLDAIIAAADQIGRGRIASAIAGGAEGKLDELWRGLGRIGWHGLPLAEGAAALLLTSDRNDAFARVIDHASTFDRGNPARALERAVEQVLRRQRMPLVDRIVTVREADLEHYANHVDVIGKTLGDALGAASAIAAVAACESLRPPKRTAANVLVVSDSMDGYASALLLEAVVPLDA